MLNTLLLATFTNKKNYKKDIEVISENYNILGGKIFVLRDIDNPFKTILTYNIPSSENDIDFLKNTISLHRKKETNTLFTLNALNMLVAEQSGKEEIDPNYSIEWVGLDDCILLTDSKNQEIKIINTEIVKIINVN